MDVVCPAIKLVLRIHDKIQQLELFFKGVWNRTGGFIIFVNCIRDLTDGYCGSRRHENSRFHLTYPRYQSTKCTFKDPSIDVALSRHDFFDLDYLSLVC